MDNQLTEFLVHLAVTFAGAVAGALGGLRMLTKRVTNLEEVTEAHTDRILDHGEQLVNLTERVTAATK